MEETEIYAAVGGDQPFFDLVEAFYARVEADPPLRALYPENLTAGKRRLAWFLIQRFGGPEYFNERRGAPRLRMRHFEFSITPAMRNAWVANMLAAIDAVPAFAPYKETLQPYFEDAATFLINREEPSEGQIRLETT